jgi:hypothetical protein
LTVSIQKHAATLNFSLKIAFYLTLNLTLNLNLKFKLKSPRWKRVSPPPKLNLIPPKHRPRLIKAELSQKSGAKPLIIESLDKANAALVLIPNDAELKTNVTSLTVKIQQLDLRISELNEMVAKANEATITTNAQMEVAANNVNGQCPTSNPTGQLLEQQPFIRCGNEIAAS